MPKIIKKIGFNVIGLLLLFGFQDKILNALVNIEEYLVLSDSKSLIVSIVLFLFVLLYYIPVLRYEKVFNSNRFLLILNISIVYFGLTKFADVPNLKYVFPVYSLIAFEVISWILFYINRDTILITISLITISLICFSFYTIALCFLLSVIFFKEMKLVLLFHKQNALLIIISPILIGLLIFGFYTIAFCLLLLVVLFKEFSFILLFFKRNVILLSVVFLKVFSSVLLFFERNVRLTLILICLIIYGFYPILICTLLFIFVLKEISSLLFRLKQNAIYIAISLIIICLVKFGFYAIALCMLLSVLFFIVKKRKHQKITSKLLIEQSKDIYKDNNTDTYHRRHTIKATVDNTIDFFSNNKSTALAIIGEWGSGKTAFKYEMQNQIKSNLNEEYIMFDFDAWACDTPQSIVKSFFTQYRKQIGKYIPKLDSVIKDYLFELLDNLGDTAFKVKHISKYVKELIGSDSEDNYDYITNFLQKAQIRSYIFIDDLDRMQADEIQEVLKLVRNTANFPYTQFILFYDKEYIVESLSGKIKNADLYLEKIINVEIPLSKIESPTLVQSFWSKIENDIKFLQDSNINNDRISINEILKKILKNEREVLQLCNKLKIVLDFFKNDKIPISYSDLIWVCILNDKYFKLYDRIASNPDVLGMSAPLAPGTGTTIATSIDDNSDIQQTEPNKDGLSQIAEELYPNDENIKNLMKYNRRHIIEDDNRYRYFCFGYSSIEFTVSDIKNNIQSELKHNVTLWTLDNRYKSNISLFKHYPIAVNELLLELSDVDFKKLRENIFHSLQGDPIIFSSDKGTPSKTIDLYKDLFQQYVTTWDCNIDINKLRPSLQQPYIKKWNGNDTKKYCTLLSRQLDIIFYCMREIDRNTIIEFTVKLLVNFQKKLNDEGFNVSDFSEDKDLSNLYESIKEEILNFLHNCMIDDSLLKKCIERMDEFSMFQYSIIPRKKLLEYTIRTRNI